MPINRILYAVADAYRRYKENFTPGKTAKELFAPFLAVLDEKLGKYEIVYDYLIGPDTVNIDGKTDDGYIPREHDTVLMDISVGALGVWCDVCRTFFVGEPTEEQRAVFNLVRSSLRGGAMALSPGAVAEDIYRGANESYSPAGLSLVHHAGHRIGDAPLLQPQFLEGNKTPLVIGEHYTVETGIYSDFGLRLENDYKLCENGGVDLFENLLPLEIEEYILK